MSFETKIDNIICLSLFVLTVPLWYFPSSRNVIYDHMFTKFALKIRGAWNRFHFWFRTITFVKVWNSLIKSLLHLKWSNFAKKYRIETNWLEIVAKIWPIHFLGARSVLLCNYYGNPKDYFYRFRKLVILIAFKVIRFLQILCMKTVLVRKRSPDVRYWDCSSLIFPIEKINFHRKYCFGSENCSKRSYFKWSTFMSFNTITQKLPSTVAKKCLLQLLGDGILKKFYTILILLITYIPSDLFFNFTLSKWSYSSNFYNWKIIIQRLPFLNAHATFVRNLLSKKALNYFYYEKISK